MNAFALLPRGAQLGIATGFGLVIGSFLNVVIYRLPVMLERQWREQCAESYGVDAGAQTIPAWVPK